MPCRPSSCARCRSAASWESERIRRLSQDKAVQSQLTTPAAPDWLQGLLRAVQREGLQPRDARVKSLWDLLQQRQVLRRSPWLQAVLRRI
jgi:hypothetical protein